MQDLRNAPDIRAIDLFCGAGGLTHGLGRAGINVRAGFDVDPDCRFPYEANNTARFFESDVNELSADDIAPHLTGGDYSLVAGCAPCQPFSSYSRSGRSRKRGEEWQLIATFGRLVKQLRPDFVTMENVAQLADHAVFEAFLKDLDGYNVTWSIVELANLGVPQSRKRLVLLASRLSDSYLEMPTTPNSQVTVREAIASLPRIEAGESDPSDLLHAASRLSPLNLQRIKSSNPGGTWRDWHPALQAECHRKPSGSTYPSVYGRMEWDRVAPTITTQCFGYGNGRFGHPAQDRAISLREAAILQTFPRTYKFVASSDPVRFNILGRLIGNAVPVRLGEVVGEVFIRHAAANHLK